jgi:hypothetical protein
MLKNKIFWFFVIGLSLSLQKSFAQITGVINSYARVTAITGNTLTFDNISLSANATSLADAFGLGKRILIIQMKGATINTSNSSSFGSLTSINNAGNYEIALVTNLIEGSPNTLIVANLSRNYTVGGSVQIVSFPQYTNITLNGTVTAIPWSRSLGRGGIVAFEASNTLTMNGIVDVSGLGFNGGEPNAISQASCNNNNTYLAPDLETGTGQRHAQKGESIADYDFNGITGQEYGRGAILTGGGGGNSHNGGGGGGSNYSQGGNGGFAWPGAGICSGSENRADGIGGYVLSYSYADNKIFLGGGGGGGQQNNQVASRGGNGGGIILVRAKNITSTCTGLQGFIANGENAPDAASNDGAGGGGAGGTILLEIYNYNLTCNLQINTNGGNGGSVAHYIEHGAGGGGGVGITLLSSSSLNPNLNINAVPGNPGLDCNDGSCGSTGNVGGNVTIAYQTGWFASGQVNPLPVTLVSFSAKLMNQKTQIQWKTATEFNTAYFEIERSNDLQAIEVINKIDAKGFSTQEQTYTVFDSNPNKGINYYRLKSVDFDGTFSTSKWICIQNGEKIALKIYPNPTSERLILEDENQTPAVKLINMFDSKGQLIVQRNFDNKTEIDVSNFAKGVYLVKISGINGLSTHKVVVR